jgi:RHS repeat-associated protein
VLAAALALLASFGIAQTLGEESLSSAGGVTQSFGYHDLRPPVQRTRGTSTWATSWADGAQSISYTYDARGNRLTESAFGEVTRYRYDGADRLTGVRYDDGIAELYELRGDGAREQRKRFMDYPQAFGSFEETPPGATLLAHETYAYDGADGLAAIVDPVKGNIPVFTDAAGRVLSQGFASYTWDVPDRMLTATVNGMTTSYAYDFQGWRTRKTSPLEDVTYVWGKDGIEAEHPTGNAAARRTYAHGAGMVLGVGDEVFGHDALGSPIVRATASGTTTTRFDAWGQVRVPPTTGPPVVAGLNQTGFTGHNNDLESGLVYAQARYLDASTGRFLSLDPVAGAVSDPFSTQGFIYGHSNPTRFIDPDGRASTETVTCGNPKYPVQFMDCERAQLQARGWDAARVERAVVARYKAAAAQQEIATGSTPLLKRVVAGIVTAVAGGSAVGGTAPGGASREEMQLIREKDPLAAPGVGGAPMVEPSASDVAIAPGVTSVDSFHDPVGTGSAFEDPVDTSQYEMVLASRKKLGGGLGKLAEEDEAKLRETRSQLVDVVRRRSISEGGFESEGRPIIVDTSIGTNSTAVAEALRGRGVNARSVPEVFGRGSAVPDEEIRPVANAIDALVVASDRGRAEGGADPFPGRRVRVPQRLRTVDAVMRVLEEAGVAPREELK